MPNTKLMAAYISDGKVTAMTEDAVYVYKHELTEKQTQKLLDRLGKANEINIDHWIQEWKKESTGIDVSQ